jgi:chromosome segregation ATPase
MSRFIFGVCMSLRSVSAILLSSIAFISTSNLTHAQSASPAELLAAMKQGNINIENDVKNIQTRCANQQKRKELLEQEILKRKPELTSLSASKTALTELLKQKDATLQGRSKTLAALRASITDLQDAIKNANTSTTTRLATLRTERDAAKKVVQETTKNINSLDDVFEKWKDEGSNEFTLYRAQFKDENNKLLPPEKRVELTQQEKSALDYLKSYDSMRSTLTQTKTTNEATIIQKDKAITDLTAGRKETVQELQRKLAEKHAAVPATIASVTAAQVDFNRAQGDLRFVTARIATLSSIVIPNIPTVCTFINQMSTPRA